MGDGKSRNLERHKEGHFQTVRKSFELNKSIEKCVTVDSVNQNIIIKKMNTYFKKELYL